jgi:RHS repeat-associated protein
MNWDSEDRLHEINLGGGGNAYYVYDSAGQRVRKVIESLGGVKRKERIYLGGFELYREYEANGQTVELERESLHVMDDARRIALVETQTVDESEPVVAPIPLQRYQLGNHLGSASLELDENGDLISYEEYHPYGTTAFQAGRSAAEVSLKRYRYTAKERDEESGFNYHGARYYAPWLGSWTSADPIGLQDGVNVFAYCGNNPVCLFDSTGFQGEPQPQEERPIEQLMHDWIDEQILKNQQRIESKKEKYTQKNWKFTDKDSADQTKRIEELKALKDKLAEALPSIEADNTTSDSITEGRKQLLTLANIIYNEAGASNEKAKEAIAYAWMNRTKGLAREPKGKAEISDYVELKKRWSQFSDTDRLKFIENFIKSIEAAAKRIADTDPAAHDPTGGATHWISPKSLEKYNPQKHKDRYKCSVGAAIDRACPKWARNPSTDKEEIKKMIKEGRLSSGYNEISIPGVKKTDFLFYKGVK